MAFMARLRTGAGESPLALRITFMSWLRPVRRKCKHAAAVSAVALARRGRNGGLLTLALSQFSGQRAINSAHSRESACEDIGVAGAMLVVAPSPNARWPSRTAAAHDHLFDAVSTRGFEFAHDLGWRAGPHL